MKLYRATYSLLTRDGWLLFLVSPSWLARLNKVLIECRRPS